MGVTDAPHREHRAERGRDYQVVQVSPGVIDTLECLHDDSAGLIGLVLDESAALLLHPLQLFLLFLHQLFYFLKVKHFGLKRMRR